MRASSQFRITLDTNRYSVPAEYAGSMLTLKTYPDRLCIYHQDKLIARHMRSYDRHQDFEDPDHPRALLAQRRMNPHHHVRKIVALSDIYGAGAVAAAMQDAFVYQAFSSEYIANLLEQRKRIRPEPSALQLTRRQDLLDLAIENPDLAIYQPAKNKDDKS
ncbi:hypothetical protein HNR65_001832 [Desulfosalsimonas propionicica]|uniref:Transposase for insertion sequence element IS21-like C-terminal domain-containing protein n=1 Tax=Desulfosalsimonas propionicica TaxID=332175 RepID=A0A7W0C989_9BACT|nr:hypothetical protein [Desulfosalsimonas propionicica]MBA2881505.1 hypothetical protein [Desulfosalsimonas propionicica]